MLAKAAGALWLAILIYADGWATWLVFHRRSHGDRQAGPGLAGLFGQVVTGVVVTGCVTLALALAGIFNAWTYSGCCLGYAVIMVAASSPDKSLLTRSVPATRSMMREALPLAVCLVIGAALFLLPYMFVFGSADEGVYPNTAGNIARSGSVFLVDPVMREVDEEHFDWFYKHYYLKEDGRRVPWFDIQEPGFYATDIDSGAVTPQFLYFFPACMAPLMIFLGVRAGFLMLTVLCLLSLWALYLIGIELMNKWAALAAAIFLAVNLLQVYFGKLSTAEIAAQSFFMAGLCFYVLYRKAVGAGGEEAAWYGFVSAVAFGAMFHTHLMSFLFLAPLGILYLYLFLSDGWKAIARDRVFLVTLGAFLAALTALMFWPYRTYFQIIVRSVSKKLSGLMIVAALAIAAALGLALLLRLSGRRLRSIVRANRRLISGMAIGVILAFFIFSVLIWPALSGNGSSLDSAEKSYRSSTMVRLAFYLTPVGMLLALLGYCLFLWRDADENNVIVPLSGLIFTAVIVYKPLVNQILPWAMRRFVHASLPVAILMAVYALYSLWRWRSGFERSIRWLKICARTVCLAAAVAFLFVSLLATAHVTKISGSRESYPVTRRISELADGGGLIICDRRAGRILPAPLRCLMGRSVLRLRENYYARDPWFVRFVEDSGQSGTPVYLVVEVNSGSMEYFDRFRLVPVGGATYHSNILEASFEPSTKTVSFAIDFQVFRVEVPET